MTTSELLDRALFASYNQRWQQAHELSEKAIQIEPDHYLAHKRLGIALWHLNETDNAITALEKSIELKPDFSSAHYNLACIHSQLNRKNKMLFHLEKAIEFDEYNEYRKLASEDEDFENFDIDEDFLKTIEIEQEDNPIKKLILEKDFTGISQLLLNLEKEIPFNSIQLYSEGNDDTISDVLEKNCHKLSTESLLYLFQLAMANTTIGYFMGFTKMAQHLLLTHNTFEEEIVKAWKQRYENFKQEQSRIFDMDVIKLLKLTKVEGALELIIWTFSKIDSEAKDSFKEINQHIIDSLTEESEEQLKFLEFLEGHYFSTTIDRSNFKSRITRVRNILAPPPIAIDPESDDQDTIAIKKLNNYHPEHIIYGAQYLIDKKDKQRELVSEKSEQLVNIANNNDLDLEIRLSAVTLVDKIGSKTEIQKLENALLDGSPKLINAIGEVMFQHVIKPTNSQQVINYLIQETSDDNIDSWALYEYIEPMSWFKSDELTKILIKALQNPLEALRREALVALGHQNTISAIPHIADQLINGSGQCVTAASKALLLMGDEGKVLLSDETIYNQVLERAKKTPRWAMEALIAFQVPQLNDDLLELLKTINEFDAYPHMANGLSRLAFEESIPKIFKIGLDRYRANEIGERYLIQIIRSVGRNGNTPPNHDIIDETFNLFKNADSDDVTDLLKKFQKEEQHCHLEKPSKEEINKAQIYFNAYNDTLKSCGDNVTNLLSIVFQ